MSSTARRPKALVRAPCYVVAGVLMICCRPTLGYRYIREGLLFAALGITLLLPCAVACGVFMATIASTRTHG